MNQNRPEHHYDDGARLAQRYNGAGRARRVTFGPGALHVRNGTVALTPNGARGCRGVCA